MIKVEVYGKTRLVRGNMVYYHTDTNLECVYKNHHINIIKQDKGNYYVTVTDQKGMYAVLGGFGGEYCRYGIKSIKDCLVMCIQNIIFK